MRWMLIAVVLAAGCKKDDANANANVETPKPEAPKAEPPKPEAPKKPPVPPASPERDAAFWTWFKDHRLEVAKLKRADEPIANEMAAELHKVDPRLIFELGIGVEPKEIIISADGLREAFPAVKRLVAAAPAIPGWKAVAFRPRKSPDLTVEMGGGLKLSANDLWFMVLPTSKPPAPMDIIVYVPGLGGKDDDGLKQVGFLLLDATVGEYDAETKIGGIAWQPIAQKPAAAKPFKELPKLMDGWK